MTLIIKTDSRIPEDRVPDCQNWVPILKRLAFRVVHKYVFNVSAIRLSQQNDFTTIWDFVLSQLEVYWSLCMQFHHLSN